MMDIEQRASALMREMKEYAASATRRIDRIERKEAGMRALASAEGRLSPAGRAQVAAQRMQARSRAAEREARRSSAPHGLRGMSAHVRAELSAQFIEHLGPMGLGLSRTDRERMSYGGRSFAQAEALVAELQATAPRSHPRR